MCNRHLENRLAGILVAAQVGEDGADLIREQIIWIHEVFIQLRQNLEILNQHLGHKVKNQYLLNAHFKHLSHWIIEVVRRAITWCEASTADRLTKMKKHCFTTAVDGSWVRANRAVSRSGLEQRKLQPSLKTDKKDNKI